jgi:hypothetical protein
VERYTGLTDFGFLTAFIVGTILSPKFKAVKTEDGEKLFMKWIFIKDVKEIG